MVFLNQSVHHVFCSSCSSTDWPNARKKWRTRDKKAVDSTSIPTTPSPLSGVKRTPSYIANPVHIEPPFKSHAISPLKDLRRRVKHVKKKRDRLGRKAFRMRFALALYEDWEAYVRDVLRDRGKAPTSDMEALFVLEKVQLEIKREKALKKLEVSRKKFEEANQRLKEAEMKILKELNNRSPKTNLSEAGGDLEQSGGRMIQQDRLGEAKEKETLRKKDSGDEEVEYDDL
ncbi:hypothetical protein ONZ45_g5669 [Pleurotus djamor]|nr:hypothetical protein ONZ45_g5669 [Pleurotus djamor]